MAQAGLLITVFAVGMIVGSPTMALLTRRMPRRTTLMLALAVFAAGHVVVALGSSFPLLLGARFVTAWATGAFWSVASVVGHPRRRSGRRRPRPRAGGCRRHARQRRRRAARRVRRPADGLAWTVLGTGRPRAGRGGAHRPARPARRRATQQPVSLRSELAALRSGRLWLVLAACATTTGGVLSVYSYISPLLTDRAGIAIGLVPLVLVGFGVGSLIGTIYGGRLGDVRPHATTIGVAAATTVVLLAICLLSAHAVPTVVLVALLGLIGLSANPVLSALAVRFAGVAPTLGVSMSVAAYNLGTAVGSWIAGLTLGSALGATGPAVVGTAHRRADPGPRRRHRARPAPPRGPRNGRSPALHRPVTGGRPGALAPCTVPVRG